MRTTVWMLAGALSLLVAPMMAAEGDSPGSDQLPWARWQGRLSLGTQSAAWPLGVEGRSAKITSGSVVGDYYFTRSLAGAGRLGGFRATSGLIFGPRGALGSNAGGLATGSSLGIGSRPYTPAPMPYTNDTSDAATVPYLGVGYTGLAARSGWSFSADLGLAAQSPGNSGRLGRAVTGTQSLDDAVRDLRLAPLLQLGVSYAF